MRYKLVLLLSAIAVAWGVFYTMTHFNEIVAPDVPVQALRFENTDADVYQVEILGERLTVKNPEEYYHVLQEQYEQAETFVRGYIAQLWDKPYVADFRARMRELVNNE